MSAERTPISSKAVVMLDAAIQELCAKNRCDEWTFAETYDIKYRGDEWNLNPHGFREQLHMDNCFPVDGTRPPVFKAIEALWEELTGPTPALFKKRALSSPLKKSLTRVIY